MFKNLKDDLFLCLLKYTELVIGRNIQIKGGIVSYWLSILDNYDTLGTYNFYLDKKLILV